jgi:hypothetical protein
MLSAGTSASPSSPSPTEYSTAQLVQAGVLVLITARMNPERRTSVPRHPPPDPDLLRPERVRHSRPQSRVTGRVPGHHRRRGPPAEILDLRTRQTSLQGFERCSSLAAVGGVVPGVQPRSLDQPLAGGPHCGVDHAHGGDGLPHAHGLCHLTSKEGPRVAQPDAHFCDVVLREPSYAARPLPVNRDRELEPLRVVL